MHVEKDHCSSNYFLKILIKIVFKEAYNGFVLRNYKINDNVHALNMKILEYEFFIILRKENRRK